MMKIHTNDISAEILTRQDNLATHILKIPVQFFNMLLVWQDRAVSRNALRDLDAHLLNDVGLNAKEAYREARKPFWVA